MGKGKFKIKGALPALTLAWAALLLLTSLAGGTETASQPASEWGGQYCGETRPLLVIIRRPQALSRLQSRRLAPPQTVDFQKSAIVGVFMGQRFTGGYGVEFQEPYVQDGRLLVPFQEYGPAPGSFVTQALTTPCRFKVVPVKPGQDVALINLNKVADLTYRPLRLAGGHFQCDLPQTWYRERLEAGLSKNPYYVPGPSDFPGELAGLMLMAPPEMEGEGVRIFVLRYAFRDQPPPVDLQTCLEKFPPDDLEKYMIKEKFKAGEPPLASGQGGQWFARQTSVSLRGTGNVMPIKEILRVIPTRTGFYALYYWAPAVLAEKYAPVFHRVVQSFRPLH